MASVSGGITGSRSAPLKEDGKIQYFDSQDAANKKATKLNREMNGPNSRASFRYTVQPA
jgi:hypothetical protein